MSLRGLTSTLRRALPGPIFRPLRSLAIALFTPIAFSRRSGHWRSAFANRSVGRRGEPLPWYTYPCIDFLRFRDFAGRRVLEFGGGQSTMWWAARAAQVTTLEGDPAWLGELARRVPGHVALHLVPEDSAESCLAGVERVLAESGGTRFDVVVIDGLYRAELAEIATRVVTDDGVVVCDNAEGYGFYEAFRDRGFARVDFYGHTPGVMRRHCTAIYFRPGAFVFDPKLPIVALAEER